MSLALTAVPTATDARVAAFCSTASPEVFSAIVHGPQIWAPDPFDIETIHADAREMFARLLNRASSSESPPHGKTLLLLGESGSGKTHLMRAFRNVAQSSGIGYCGYLHLNARADNYARYILSNVIDSLEQPYKPEVPETGLVRLAHGLLDALAHLGDERQLLRDDFLDPNEAVRLIYRFADFAVQEQRFRGIDIDLIRAVLFMVPNDSRVRARVLKWFRCEDLNRFDRELIGDLVPRSGPEMPLRTLVGLGRLIHAVHSAGFVLLVDQIEQVFALDREGEEKGEVLRQVINAVVDVMDGIPNAIVVLACLEDTFVVAKNFLPKPKLDRIERDPDPIRLSSKRSETEIAAMIAPRLDAIFETVGTAPDSANPIAPYTAADLKGLVPFRPRDILDNLRRHREACFRAGGWVPPQWSDTDGGDRIEKWSQKWNDFHKAYATPILGDEPQLAGLLASTIERTSTEMPTDTFFGVDPDERIVEVDVNRPGNVADRLCVAVCDRNARGGGLGNQIEEVINRAGEIPAVLVRSTEYPRDPNSVVMRQIAKLVAPRGKGRRVVVTNSDWRAMAAFRDFHGKHCKVAGFTEWQRDDKPLSQLQAIRAVLALDELLAAPPAPVPPSPPPPPIGRAKEVAPALPPARAATGPVRLGATRSAASGPVELVPKDLCRHAAFLGGSGSGKTTAALTVIEQLLLAGVPAVLLDRKGDLAQYASTAAWTGAEPDPDRAARRARLRAAIDVRLYTPGTDAGRPLAIPVVPSDLGQLSAAEQEQTAQFAAASLGVILGYKGKSPDPKLVILQKAIEVIGRATGTRVTVKAVQQLVDDRDDALTTAVGGFDDKHYKKLAEDLLTLAHQHRRLLEIGDPLDVDALLGRGPHTVAGKTRLTIINTQFLRDSGTTDFWVSQFLLAIDRWRAKNPTPDGRLQAVFLFDEADQYLPAIGKPATKGPMESLLRRGRSAGLGIFLATQSPGDFDYKCRDQILTWLVGKVKEAVAINKMKPLFESGRSDAMSKLSGQEAGQFFLVRESDVAPIRTDRNLIPTTQLSEDQILAAARPSGAPRSA